MMKIGIAGIGFMGWIHYLAYRRVAGVKVAAICEQNKKRLGGDWRDIQGNFGPAGNWSTFRASVVMTTWMNW